MSKRKLNTQLVAADLATISLSGYKQNVFYEALLKRVAKFMSAPGGALWLIAGDGSRAPDDWSLAAAFGQDNEPLLTRKHFHPAIQQCINHTLQHSQRLLVQPGGRIGGRNGGNNGARNESGACWYFHRLQFKSRLLGVIGFALPANIDTGHIDKREPLLDTLGQYIVTHAASGLKKAAAATANSETSANRQTPRQNQKLSQLLQFSNGLVGQLDTHEAALYIANQARDLVGVDRAAVLRQKHGKWIVQAVSGNETVDKNSNFIKALARLCGEPPNVERTTDEYRLHRLPEPDDDTKDTDPRQALAQTSRTREILFLPLLNASGKEDFCLSLESAKTETFAAATKPEEEKKDSSSQPMLLSWTSNIASKALGASIEHHDLPLRRTLSFVRRWFGEEKRGALRKRLTWVGAILVAILVVMLWPVQLKSSGECWLYPIERDTVVAEDTGRIKQVLVEEGSRITAGQLLGAFDTLRWETEADIAKQVRLSAETEMRRHQSAGDMTAYQVARLEAEKAAQQQSKYEDMVQRGKFHSPLDGVVLTKDIHKSIGKVLQTGEIFCEVASLNNWELQIAVDESDFTTLERSLEQHGTLDVAYILNANSSLTLDANLDENSRISQMAYASGNSNIFFVTIPAIALPESLQDRVRPGFTGTARIRMGRQPFGYVIFRKFIHLLRMNWLI